MITQNECILFNLFNFVERGREKEDRQMEGERERGRYTNSERDGGGRNLGREQVGWRERKGERRR